MKKRVLGVALVAALGAGLLPATAALANERSEPLAINVEGFVVDQQCVGTGGDFVEVTLSAMAQSTVQPVRYAWDFTANGSFDTGPLADPTVQNVYPDEVNVTVRVGAANRNREVDVDTFSFATLRCE